MKFANASQCPTWLAVPLSITAALGAVEVTVVVVAPKHVGGLTAHGEARRGGTMRMTGHHQERGCARERFERRHCCFLTSLSLFQSTRTLSRLMNI